jgi:hypothetical protein
MLEAPQELASVEVDLALLPTGRKYLKGHHIMLAASRIYLPFL